MTTFNEEMKPNIPNGFEPCHGSFCPSCHSFLIRKIDVESDSNTNYGKEQLNPSSLSLRAANMANLLLTALSFDASTRNSSSPKETSRIVPGVSYCVVCNVHVVINPDELELLLPDGSNDEWLRGSILLAVDDEDVDALLTTQNKFTSKYTDVTPRKPQDFDYDYRHKVATKTMRTKMKKGYTLTEDICNDCEMPFMKNDKQAKECVVCPKLWQKIKRRDDSFQRDNKTEPTLIVDKQQDSEDVVSAIIAEARRATMSRENQKASSLDKILSGRVASSNTAVSVGRTKSTNHFSISTSDCPPPNPLQIYSEKPVPWDKLLVSGRLLSSKRLHQGWTFSERNCLGSKCNGTLLMREAYSQNEVCMVCGGSGNGFDGYYASEKGKDISEDEPNWEARLENGRSLLAQRLAQGWTMDVSNCEGYQCNNMPLIKKLGGEPSSCVVCGGSGSGCDGIYEQIRSAEVVDAERQLVSQEISHLMSLGWILRDSLCPQCFMPLVSEHEESNDLCILCGEVTGSAVVNGPVHDFSKDDVSNEAGKRLKLGWTLPNASLCNHCRGLQMIPPNSTEMSCIMPGCANDTEYNVIEPNVLQQNGSITRIGRGFDYSNVNNTSAVQNKAEATQQHSLDDEPSTFPFNYVGVPHNDEDPSVLSDDMSQTRSVTTSALGDILERLDNAKYELKVLSRSSNADPLECTAKQVEIASLIEKIARACEQS